MALEDWFQFEPQCCGGVHFSASADWLNDQQDSHCQSPVICHSVLLDTANVFRGKHITPIRGYFFFGYVNTVVNCKDACWDDGHERVRGSGKKEKDSRDRRGDVYQERGGLRYVMWFVGSL